LFINGLLSAGLLTAAVVFQAKSMWLIPAAIALALLLMMIPVILARSTHYCISNYRIDFERGVLSKNIDTLELWHVEDIKFHQSLLDRILCIGTVTIISRDDTNPYLPLRALPDPRPIFESLKQRIITVKRQRGVIKLDAG
jgi:membrane protein YdbS with pleckstrin-like domain